LIPAATLGLAGPTSTVKLAELATPLLSGGEVLPDIASKISGLAQGKSLKELFPTGKTYPEFTATDYGKLLGQVGVGAAQAFLIHKGLTPKPPLSEVAGIAKPETPMAAAVEPVPVPEVQSTTITPTETKGV